MVGFIFKVQPQQLLLAADHTQLDGGLQSGVTGQMGLDAGLLHQGFELAARFVVADYAHKARDGSKSGDVEGHIGSAANASCCLGVTALCNRCKMRLERSTVSLPTQSG